uniref:Uncharacterized protein n=1 Tax=Romanomermis culicivorax TaxID=13658 RepID=A0A915I985_ROMCU
MKGLMIREKIMSHGKIRAFLDSPVLYCISGGVHLGRQVFQNGAEIFHSLSIGQIETVPHYLLGRSAILTGGFIEHEKSQLNRVGRNDEANVYLTKKVQKTV